MIRSKKIKYIIAIILGIITVVAATVLAINLCVMLSLEMVAQATLILGQLGFLFCDRTFVIFILSCFLKIFRSFSQE